MDLNDFSAHEIRDQYLRHKLNGSEAVRQRTEVEWLVDRLFPKASLLILAGEAKTAGKSTLMHCLATAVAFGTPFLGVHTQKGPVILANVEDGIGRIGRRLHAFGVPEENCNEIDVFHSVEGVKCARRAVTMGVIPAPALFIVDPLLEIEAADGLKNENDPLEVTAAMKPWRDMVRKSGCTCILVHHYRKGGDMMRGSTAYMAASDGWIDYAMDEPGSNRRRVCFWLRDDVPGNEMMVEYKAVDGRATFTRVEMSQAENEESAGKPNVKSNSTGRGTGKVNGKGNGKWNGQAKVATRRGRMMQSDGKGRPKVDYSQLQLDVVRVLINQAGGLDFDVLRDVLATGRDALYICLNELKARGLVRYDGRTHTWVAE